MQIGATFVAVGSDLGLLRTASQALRDKFRDNDIDADDAAVLTREFNSNTGIRV
jgi:hypothetical protein